ncbi:MAG: hypothetical protein KDA21_02765, partial [Phycisphaerales bacterium]|nr:hypothetical protein [Phycisphaerales bacterium]
MATTKLLHPEVEASVRQLKGALLDVMVSVGADPRRPQTIHRRFQLDRVLCWKVSRIEKATAAEEALNYLPGAEAFRIYLDAFEREGADKDAVQRSRDAVRTLSEKLERHVGDRTTLELVLDGAARKGEQLLV